MPLVIIRCVCILLLAMSASAQDVYGVAFSREATPRKGSAIVHGRHQQHSGSAHSPEQRRETNSRTTDRTHPNSDEQDATSGPADSLTLADAVKHALTENPDIRRQRWEVDIRRGDVESTAGSFDLHLLTSASTNRTNTFAQGLNGSNGLTKATASGTRYRVALARTFRNGLTVEPFLEVQQDQTLQSTLAPRNRTLVGTRLSYSVLQGGGTDVVTAPNRAARRSLRASTHRHRHVATQTAYRMIEAFWGYIAARKILAIVRRSEEQAETLLEETKLLVKLGERPAADLEQPRANLANTQARRISSERSLTEARKVLLTVLGTTTTEADTLRIAGSSFPEAPANVHQQLQRESEYVTLALHERSDLLAARDDRRASSIRLDAARDARQPSLDIAVDVGYAGSRLDESMQRSLSPFGQDVSGVNATLSVSSDLSFRNRDATGRVQSERARQEQTILRVHDLTRTIRIDVETTLQLLRSSLEQMAKSQEAIRLYQSVVENENKEYRLGMATIFDVIMAEERLTEALINRVQDQQQYAILLARLRLETSTLLQFEHGRATVGPIRLESIPRLPQSEIGTQRR